MQFQFDQALPVLQRTPAALQALLLDVPDPWTRENEGEGTWSVREVVAHLIHGENTDWIPRVRHLLDFGESRAFTPFDREGNFAAAREVSLPKLLDEFATRRADSLAVLAALRLGDADLDRTGLHPELGTVTLRHLLSTWVAHDLTHLSQITRIMARQYREAVGPWVAYFRLLR